MLWRRHLPLVGALLFWLCDQNRQVVGVEQDIDELIKQVMSGIDERAPPSLVRSAALDIDETADEDSADAFQNPYGGYSRNTELSDAMERRNQVVAKVLELAGNDSSILDSIDVAFERASSQSLCPPRPRCDSSTKNIRTFDGTCNNVRNPEWGSAGIAFLRYLEPAYADGRQEPRGGPKDTGNGGQTPPSARVSCVESRDRALPSPREITRKFHFSRNQSSSTHSDMLMQVGQFLDHDITLTPLSRVRGDCCRSRDRNCFPYSIPRGDPTFRNCFGVQRSLAHCEDPRKNREQLNSASAFLDGSQIYGDDTSRVRLLRQRSRGFMKMSTDGLDLGPTMGFGDSRGTSHPMLMSMHTLFLREHNRIAQELADRNPKLARDDETLFQMTRQIVIAEWQNIIYGEYLPTILGSSTAARLGLSISERSRYDPESNPSLRNDFSTAAFRFGHSQIQDTYKRVDTCHAQGLTDLTIKDEFFKDKTLTEDGARGMNRVLEGLFSRGVQSADRFFSETVTERLFGLKLDLVSINIQRGRDHGIPSYNEYREFCGFSPACTWSSGPNEISREDWRALSDVYLSPSDIDLYVGGITEEPFAGGVVGRTFNCILGRQFQALKDGDRFFFSHLPGQGVTEPFSDAQFQSLSRRTLGDLICDNSEVKTVREEVMDLKSSPKCCLSRNALDLSLFAGASRP